MILFATSCLNPSNVLLKLALGTFGKLATPPPPPVGIPVVELRREGEEDMVIGESGEVERDAEGITRV